MSIPPATKPTASEAQERLCLSVVIPAYNESSRISATIGRVLEYLDTRWKRWEVVIVDDGSSDGTATLVKSLRPADTRLRVISYLPNRGKGFAVRTGMLAAQGDLVLFSDADLSAPIEEVEKLIPPLLGDYQLAIGSRALRRELIEVRQSRMRELAGQSFNLALRVITGLNFHDTQCGFKLFRREAVKPVFERQLINSFGFDPEILFLAAKYGFRTCEVPVRWAHTAGSKVRVLRDGLGMVADLLRIRCNELTGKYPARSL